MLDKTESTDDEQTKRNKIALNRNLINCQDVTNCADCKPILVLVNPRSGRGQSIKTLKSLVIPMLKLNKLEYKVCITEDNLRVQNYLSEENIIDLSIYKSILIVSGDGLLHETINTLLSRLDWRKAMSLPLGIVPTGSGNGMAYTLVRQRHANLRPGKEALRFCCRQALQDDTCLSDLIRINYGKTSVFWSFLSFGWGLLSDIDVDSDWLRRVGELRFTIYGLLRSFTATSYKGKLSYKPKDISRNNSNETNNKSDYPDDKSIIEATSETKPDFMSNLNTDFELKDNDTGWIEIEDDFTCVYVVYQSHISSGTKIAPQSKLADQTMYLTYIRGKLSVMQVIKFLLAIDDGTHDKLDFVTVAPVESFVLEPSEPSKVVVDGETIPWTLEDGPLRAQVVPKLMKILWCPNLSPN